MIKRQRSLRFEAHAVKRMKQRGISEQQVEQVVAVPDRRRPARRRGAVRLEKALSPKKRLAVIIEETGRYIRVITAFWL